MKLEQDLQGRLRNVQLGKTRGLLPAFEVIVNAFQAIEEAPRDRHHQIDVVVTRESILPGLEDEKGEIRDIVVTDTGVGFDELNMRSFLTSDSQHKSARGGKGVGRFTWLKAFDHAHVVSHYYEKASDDHLWQRTFMFAIGNTNEVEDPPVPSEQTTPLTTVKLAGMKKEYQEHAPRTLETIGSQIVEHCLPFFIDPKCPKVTLRDESERVDLNEFFKNQFGVGSAQHSFKVGQYDFTIRGLHLTSAQEKRHRLVYAADHREVIPERLDKVIPNLSRRLEDSDGKKFVYLGWIAGQYLNEHVNHERTGFSFPLDASDGTLPTEEPTQAEIRDAAVELVKVDLADYLRAINDEKRQRIETFVTVEEPEYRSVMRYINEFIDRVPPGASKKELDLAMHEQMYQKQRELRREGTELMTARENQALTPEDYTSRLTDFLERANEIGKASLARYVAHRRVMLGFLEKSLEADPTTGKYEMEKVIHQIIYPMRSLSGDVPYEQQNLWIIDERLSYHDFLASDMPLREMPVLDNDSGSRPDLLIFERALSFSDDEHVHNSMVIVEFKKPDKFSKREEDPVDQVYRLIREIRSGHFKDSKGKVIKVANPEIPAYAYVICDLDKKMDLICENKSMTRTPDNLGWYAFNGALHTYVEVISYTKLLSDAKKRNRVLFARLNIPLSPGKQGA